MLISHKKLLVFIIIPVTFIGLCVTAMLTIIIDNKIYVVFSDSMTPNLNSGDIVVVAKKDLNSRSSFDNLKVGEIIVFAPQSNTTSAKELSRIVVHRVVAIETDSSGTRVIRTKGDANPDSIQALDFPITMENYIGKVTYVIPYLGPMLMYFDLIIRVFLHPLLYMIIGSIIVVILVLYRRERGRNSRNRNE